MPKQAPITIIIINKNSDTLENIINSTSLIIIVYPKTINTSNKIKRFKKWFRKKINFIIIKTKIIRVVFNIKDFLNALMSLRAKKIKIICEFQNFIV